MWWCMVGRVNGGGLVVAGVGFFLTRFTVTLTANESAMRFFVADVDAAVARTTALWCVVGTGTMLVLVAVALAGSPAGG